MITYKVATAGSPGVAPTFTLVEKKKFPKTEPKPFKGAKLIPLHTPHNMYFTERLRNFPKSATSGANVVQKPK